MYDRYFQTRPCRYQYGKFYYKKYMNLSDLSAILEALERYYR